MLSITELYLIESGAMGVVRDQAQNVRDNARASGSMLKSFAPMFLLPGSAILSMLAPTVGGTAGSWMSMLGNVGRIGGYGFLAKRMINSMKQANTMRQQQLAQMKQQRELAQQQEELRQQQQAQQQTFTPKQQAQYQQMIQQQQNLNRRQINLNNRVVRTSDQSNMYAASAAPTIG